MKMNGTHRKCIARMGLPDFFLESQFCSRKIMDILNNSQHWHEWDAVMNEDSYSMELILEIEEHSEEINERIANPITREYFDAMIS